MSAFYLNYQHRNRWQRGFTLVELLVVMAILGLLTTVGLASFRTARLKSRDAQRKHDLGQIQEGLEMYYNDIGRYPSGAVNGKITGCGSQIASPTECDWGSSWQLGPTLYMKTMPIDQKTKYCYESSTGKYYKLYARLENSRDPSCLGGNCYPPPRSCGGDANFYNYGVASSNESP